MKTRNYREDLLGEIRNDPEFAAEYINAAILEGLGAFLVAIKDLIDARGGGTEFSSATGVPRESIYKMFHNEGNPTFKNVFKALDFAEMQFKIVPKHEEKTFSA